MELRGFFDRALRASFHDLALGNDPASSYLADLLTRFARTENLYPRGVTMPRLETVVDLLLEAETVWEDPKHFKPEHEVAVSRHIGDFTLFMTGIFRERVERTASIGYYVTQGKRAYHFVWEHDRASSRAAADAAPLYRRLADGFERYAGALDYTRRVYFIDHPQHPFFQLRFG